MLADQYQWLRLDVDATKSYILEDAGGIVDVDVRIPSERGLQPSGGFSSTCLEGGVVYVFEGDLQPAEIDDIDNNEPNPLVTATVKQQDDGSYAYKVNFLPIGPYTVALTCDTDKRSLVLRSLR
jgi:hypothetical protein